MVRLRVALFLAAVCAAIPVRAQSPRSSVAPKPDSTPSSQRPSTAAPAGGSHALQRTHLEAFFVGIIPLQLERSDEAGATVLLAKEGNDVLTQGYVFYDG